MNRRLTVAYSQSFLYIFSIPAVCNNQVNQTGENSTSVLSILASPQSPFVKINPRGGLYFFTKFIKLLPGLGELKLVYFTSIGIKSQLK
jgi:hypothetical protein